jgi:protein-L-isoaspartate O-methyltransferase
MSVLDIGSGCGHFTALAGFLCGKEGLCHGLEIRNEIIEFARGNLKNFEKEKGVQLPNVSFVLRNCFVPDLDENTYDRIHVGASCPEELLPDLYRLLKPNGIIVTPVGSQLIKGTKEETGKVKVEYVTRVRYGDLVIPKESEILAAKRALEKKKNLYPISSPKHSLTRLRITC